MTDVKEAKEVKLEDGAPAPDDISGLAGANFAMTTPVAEQNGKTAGAVGYGPVGLPVENEDQQSVLAALTSTVEEAAESDETAEKQERVCIAEKK